MGTEILRPQDFLTERIRAHPAAFSRRKSCNYGNSFSNPRANPKRNTSPNPRPSWKQHQQVVRSDKQDQKRRFGQPEPPVSKRYSSDDIRTGKTGLSMEKVTILRRGESLDSKIKSELNRKKGVNDLAPKQVHEAEFRSPLIVESNMYAGSAFAVSPEPSSLPLPSFSKKKQIYFDDSATRDLRRLLRLD